MLKKVPSNVSDISDDNTSGIDYKIYTYGLHVPINIIHKFCFKI